MDLKYNLAAKPNEISIDKEQFAAFMQTLYGVDNNHLNHLTVKQKLPKLQARMKDVVTQLLPHLNLADEDYEDDEDHDDNEIQKRSSDNILAGITPLFEQINGKLPNEKLASDKSENHQLDVQEYCDKHHQTLEKICFVLEKYLANPKQIIYSQKAIIFDTLKILFDSLHIPQNWIQDHGSPYASIKITNIVIDMAWLGLVNSFDQQIARFKNTLIKMANDTNRLYQHDDYELFHTFLIFWSNQHIKDGEISEIEYQNLLKNLHIFGTDDKFFVYSTKPKREGINAANSNNNVLMTPKRYITVRAFHPDSAAISDSQVRQRLQTSVVGNFFRAQLQITIIERLIASKLLDMQQNMLTIKIGDDVLKIYVTLQNTAIMALEKEDSFRICADNLMHLLLLNSDTYDEKNTQEILKQLLANNNDMVKLFNFFLKHGLFREFTYCRNKIPKDKFNEILSLIVADDNNLDIDILLSHFLLKGSLEHFTYCVSLISQDKEICVLPALWALNENSAFWGNLATDSGKFNTIVECLLQYGFYAALSYVKYKIPADKFQERIGIFVTNKSDVVIKDILIKLLENASYTECMYFIQSTSTRNEFNDIVRSVWRAVNQDNKAHLLEVLWGSKYKSQFSMCIQDLGSETEVIQNLLSKLLENESYAECTYFIQEISTRNGFNNIIRSVWRAVEQDDKVNFLDVLWGNEENRSQFCICIQDLRGGKDEDNTGIMTDFLSQVIENDDLELFQYTLAECTVNELCTQMLIENIQGMIERFDASNTRRHFSYWQQEREQQEREQQEQQVSTNSSSMRMRP